MTETDMEGAYEEQLKKAEKRVRLFDSMEGYSDRRLVTIRFALEAGLRNPSTGAAFDALVMLRDITTTNSVNSKTDK